MSAIVELAGAAVSAAELPRGVQFAEAFGDLPVRVSGLDRTQLVDVSPRRRREYFTTRYCAMRALAELGVAEVSLPWGRGGEPMWPAGVVGSLTHTHGYRAAVVAKSNMMKSLGLDAEPAQPLLPQQLRRISRPAERASLLSVHPSAADRLLFSAKEAVYKAWYPLTGKPLDFRDIVMRFDPDQQCFQATPAIGMTPADADVLSALAGRWFLRRGRFVTIAAFPTSAAT